MRYDNTSLTQVSFLSFIRTLKAHNLYMYFVGNINSAYSGINFIIPFYNDIKRIFPPSHCAFYDCPSVESILRYLEHCATETMHFYHNDGSDKWKQEYLMCCANILVHEFVEKNQSLPIEVVIRLGQETFEKSCRYLFGNDYIDLTEAPRDVPMPNTYIDMVDCHRPHAPSWIRRTSSTF